MSDTKKDPTKVIVDGVEYTIRRPKFAEWRLFKAAVVSTRTSEDGVHVIDGNENLAKACCTSHTATQLDVLVEDSLDLFDDLAQAISAIANKKAGELDSKS